MFVIISYLIVTIFSISFCHLEKRIYKTWLTPLNLFSLPLLTVLGILILLSFIYETPHLGLEIILWYAIYITSFGLLGLLFFSIIKSHFSVKSIHEKFSSRNSLKIDTKLDKLFIYLGICSGTYLIFDFFYLAKGVPNLLAITYSSFQDEYSGGINFYLRIICMVVIAYFIGTLNNKEKLKLFVVFIAYIPLVLGLVKGIVMVPLIAGFILRYLCEISRFKIKKTILLICLSLIIFIGIYTIEDGLGNANILNLDFYVSKIEKFLVYLISGTQSFNTNLTNNYIFKNYGVVNPTFAPFNNLLVKIFDVQRIDYIPSVETFIGNFKYNGIVHTNTNTYIGTLILYNGYYIGFLTHIVWIIISYALFYRAILSNKIIHYLTYSLFSFTLVMAWFDYWYLHSYWYYMWIIIELIYFTIKLMPLKTQLKEQQKSLNLGKVNKSLESCSN